ncbi:MAG: glycosyltransferase family 2 protein [archaeon]
MVTAINVLSYLGVYISLFASIFFFYTFFENRRKEQVSEPKEWPSVTIAIPAWNAEKGLAKTVESLLQLDYPREKLQIMVVENSNSTDKTLEIARSFESKGVEVYSTPEKGKGPAMNFALTKTTGELFGALDADSVASPESLKRLVSYFTADDIVAVTPTLKVQNAKTLLQRIQQIEYLTGVFLRKVFDYLGSIHVTPGPMTLYKKAFFDRYGNYDPHNLTEDMEVALRIQSNNLRIRNVIDANIYTSSPKGFFVLMRQRVRWYLGFIENMHRYRHLFSSKFGILARFILPMAFISIILAVFFSVYASYRLLLRLINYVPTLNAINFDVVTSIKSFTFNIMNYIPSFQTLLAIPLFFVAFGMIFLARRYSHDKSKINFFYIVYFIFYIYLFSFWWIATVLYKLFAPEFRWGGLIWKNSLLNQLLHKV